MKAYIATCLAGSIAVDEKGNVIGTKPFDKEPSKIAGHLSAIAAGSMEEEMELKKDLQSKGFEIEETGEEDNRARQFALDNFRVIAKKGFAESDEMLNEIISKACEIYSSLKAGKGRGRILPHAVGVYDELNKELNEFSERLREWYGIEDMEGTMAVRSQEELAKTIASKKSFAVFEKEDMKAVSMFAEAVLRLHEAKKYMETYIASLEKEMMPTLAAVAGGILTSRLIAEAGGLEKLARMPSSRIQLLGAEKALFRHLRQMTKAPKYGLLFGHRLVQQAPPERRGKAARLVAAKISLAAKIDFFSKVDRGKEMASELEKKVKGIAG